MSLVIGVILGFLAGFIGANPNRRGEWTPLDIALGVVGAIVGGSIFNTGDPSVTELSIVSPVTGIVGVIAFLIVAKTLRRLS